MYSFSYLKPFCYSISSSNCCFLICIQFSQEADQVVWYSHLFKNFPVCCSAHKGFSVVNEADVFLAFSWFFYDPTDVGNLISGSSGFSKSSLYIWKFSVHVLWKLSLENFEYYFASMWNECNCGVVWVQLLPLAWSKSGQKKIRKCQLMISLYSFSFCWHYCLERNSRADVIHCNYHLSSIWIF